MYITNLSSYDSNVWNKGEKMSWKIKESRRYCQDVVVKQLLLIDVYL